MQALQWVNNVLLVGIRIFLKVALTNLTHERHEIFKFYSSKTEKLMLLENFVSHILQRIFTQNGFKMEHIKTSWVDLFQSDIQMFFFHINEVDYLQKL